MERETLSSDDDKASEKDGLEKMTPTNWAARYYGVMMQPKGAQNTPYGSEILPMSKFDPNKPQEGVYMDSPDSFVEVLPCTTSVDDLSTTVVSGFEFQKVDSESDSGSSRFAYVTYSVMKDGTVAIPDAKVNGYTQDSAGNWVQKRK